MCRVPSANAQSAFPKFLVSTGHGGFDEEFTEETFMSMIAALPGEQTMKELQQRFCVDSPILPTHCKVISQAHNEQVGGWVLC